MISARSGVEIVAKSGLVKNLSRKRDVDITLTDNPDDILDDPEIDIVVELMGGIEEPYEIVKKALKKASILYIEAFLLR
jgi:homoserine dehydrogenase